MENPRFSTESSDEIAVLLASWWEAVNKKASTKIFF
jgi:hypothetical protein